MSDERKVFRQSVQMPHGDSRWTVDGLVRYCRDRGIDTTTAEVYGGSLAWTGPESDEHWKQRLLQEDRARRGREAWERETFERLRAKFEALEDDR